MNGAGLVQIIKSSLKALDDTDLIAFNYLEISFLIVNTIYV